MLHFKKDNKSELPLDVEWVELMMMAKELGFTPEEIRDFLNEDGPNVAVC